MFKMFLKSIMGMQFDEASGSIPFHTMPEGVDFKLPEGVGFSNIVPPADIMPLVW